MPSLKTVQANLWSKAPYTPWLVKGAVTRAREAYGTDGQGSVLDVGALKADGAGIAMVRTPEKWVYFNEKEHGYIANVFNRVGPGWSFGSNSIHNTARAWFETVHGRQPDAMENVDIQFNRVLFESLRQQALGSQNPVEPIKPPVTQPPVVPPAVVPPTPAPASLRPLSPASVRADELRSLIRSTPIPVAAQVLVTLTVDGLWPITRAFAIEAIRVWRLARKKLGDARELPVEDR